MADHEEVALSTYYYRDNFLRLCDTVEAQYSDILTSAESAFLARYRELPFNAQCLYVRLVSRTGPWFRESKLMYAELGPISPILNELLACEMVEEGSDLSVDEVGKLYTREELQLAFGARLISNRSASKENLLHAIAELELDACDMRIALSACDPLRVVGPVAAELVEHLQILFFGNRHQSLTEFVLEDLGVTRYFAYQLDRTHRLFSCRDAFDEYLNCAALGDAHRALVELGDHDALPALAAQVLTVEIRFPSSENRWHRLCNRLARDLERLDYQDVALQLYQRSSQHPARERRARILERRGSWAEAAELCTQILLDPWCEAEREAAARIQPRVQRKLGGGSQPRKRDAFSNVTLHLPRGGEPVEQLAATFLRSEWQAVHYVENSLMNTLFGLAFWEQIFDAVPGVFHHAFQAVPADMYERTFRSRRESAIATRLQQLRAGNLGEMLREAYQRYYCCQCHWVDWRRIDAALVAAAARIVPAAHLLAIWERMLFDPEENRRGFPDLVALGKRAGDYCLIEVKGPGDALQDSQKRWLRFFQAQQIPAQVAWVEWAR